MELLRESVMSSGNREENGCAGLIGFEKTMARYEGKDVLMMITRGSGNMGPARVVLWRRTSSAGRSWSGERDSHTFWGRT